MGPGSPAWDTAGRVWCALWGSRRFWVTALYQVHREPPSPASSLTCPLMSQVEQLYVRQLVEEAGKGCGPGSLMQAPEEPPPDQVFRMFPEICASHQRPFFRENQQITV